MILKRNGSWLLWWEGSCKDRLGGMHEVNKSPEQMAWKARGTEFHEFWQPAGLGLDRAERALGLLLGRRQGKQHTDIQCGNSVLKSSWGTQWRGYLLILDHVPERQCSWRAPSGNKRTGQCHFPHLPFNISTGPPVWISTVLVSTIYPYIKSHQ